jgi:hypothetical protein
LEDDVFAFDEEFVFQFLECNNLTLAWKIVWTLEPAVDWFFWRSFIW